ncbi:MAG: hypothetical protein GXN95_06650 [Methanococci archaeon]|nr:hypothetical protein [Methanococci archaeon]
MEDSKIIKEINVYAVATDPVYMGTGGYTIGRVDNTIVRDPTTKIPKIPGSSLAGTWRYYVALKLFGFWKEKIEKLKEEDEKFNEFKEKLKGIGEIEDTKIDSLNKDELKTTSLKDFLLSLFEELGLKIEKNGNKKNGKLEKQKKIFEKLYEVFNSELENKWFAFEGNRYAGIKCAGQDDKPNIDYESAKDEKTGHCGRCIVCKAFGFSKKDVSWQGLVYFSDLNILFFPVYTRFGVKWITSKRILEDAGIKCNDAPKNNDEVLTKKGDEEHINLGWLYLKVRNSHNLNDNAIPKIDGIEIKAEDIIIVPDDLISQIINSNLEVRTSVSIDPITGTAKEGALFTSEAIPRGTIFYGKIRIFDKKPFEEINDDKTNKLKPLPTFKMIKDALKDSKIFFETLGIGGMTTRGFGRLKIELFDEN